MITPEKILTSANHVFLLETGLVLGGGEEGKKKREEADAWREVMDYANFQEELSDRLKGQLGDFESSSPYYTNATKRSPIS